MKNKKTPANSEAKYRSRGPIPMTTKKLEIKLTEEDWKAKNMKFGTISRETFKERIENAKKLKGRMVKNTFYPADFESNFRK